MHLWDPQLIPFASDFTLIRYDMRGHGLSDAPETGYSIQHYVSDLYALLQHLGVEKTHLWGSSLGGSIAIRFALDHPEMVETLILAGSLLEGYPLESIAELNRERIRRAREEDVESALEWWLTYEVFDGVRADPVARRWLHLQDTIATYSGAAWLDEATYQEASPSSRERLGELSVPVLILVGENEMEELLEIADLLAGEIASAQKVTFSNTGHLPQWENPKVVNQTVRNFIGASSKGEGHA
jgi:pimeloyl-ACP methyl ester carboxylesterase